MTKLPVPSGICSRCYRLAPLSPSALHYHDLVCPVCVARETLSPWGRFVKWLKKRFG